MSTAPASQVSQAWSSADGEARGWTVLSCASAKGITPFNEDMAGAAGAFAWIVDASGFASGESFTRDLSEGAWLAQRTDALLRAMAREDVALPVLAARLEDELQRDYAALAEGHPECPRGEGPTAALGVIRLTRLDHGHCQVDGLFIGDATITIIDGSVVRQWADRAAAAFEARTIAASRGDRRPGDGPIPQPSLAQIQENRRSLNRADGYWAVHPALPWRDGVRFFSTRASTDAKLLLASDGFMRLADMFGRYDGAMLVQAVAQRGASALLDELRALEVANPTAERYARVKIHDDATALLVTPHEAP